jgi:nitrogen regulatory protein PII
MEGFDNKLLKKPQLVVLILREEELLEELLRRWEEAGTSGTTILDCIGRTQLREALRMDDVPLFPSLADLTRSESVGEKLVFTVVYDEELAQDLIRISRQLLEYSSTGKGLVFTIPVGSVFGLGQTATP